MFLASQALTSEKIQGGGWRVKICVQAEYTQLALPNFFDHFIPNFSLSIQILEQFWYFFLPLSSAALKFEALFPQKYPDSPSLTLPRRFPFSDR